MLKRFLFVTVVPIALWAVPNKPSNLQLTADTHSVDITWGDNSQDENGFKIFRDGQLISIVPPNVTNYKDLGLSAGTTYRYMIKATDDDISDYIISNILAQMDEDTITFKVNGHLRDDFHAGFFIDSDNNPDTGYSKGTLKGADYLVQSNGLYRYPEGKHGWHWEKVDGVDVIYKKSASSFSFTFPLLSLANHANFINYTADVSTNDWNHHYYRKESNFHVINEIGNNIIIIGPSTVFFSKEQDAVVYEPADGDWNHAPDCRMEGWGERLWEYATNDQIASHIYNYARPGAGAYSFTFTPDHEFYHTGTPIDQKINRSFLGPNRDHYWGAVKKKMRELGKGILLMQFGGNDWIEHRDTEDLFKGDVQKLIDEAKELHFTPVLISSIEKRVRDDDGDIKRSRGAFPRWMKEVAQANHLRVLDLNQKSYEEYSRYSDEELKTNFSNCYNRWGHQLEDTHTQVKGAKKIASWIKELACEESDSKLCKLLSGTPNEFKITSSRPIPDHGIPAMEWSNVPQGTKSFAVIIDDHSNNNWVHWVAINIDKDTHAIVANTVPQNAVILKNELNTKTYSDPNYPNEHHYVAHIYALDIEDLREAKFINGDPIFADNKYDHEEFEKRFANFIIEKSSFFF